MKYRSIPDTDLKVSVVALGTWVFGGSNWGGARQRDCIDAVSEALDRGINFIDTSPVYGRGVSETIVGKAVKNRRDKFIIATKCGLSPKGKQLVHDMRPESVKKEIEVSLKNLNTDYVDLYQCHWPDPGVPVEDTMGAMVELKNQGKIKHIGVCNFDVDLLRRARTVADVVSSQNQYSLLERSIEEDVLPFCSEEGIGVIAYGPLAGGILSGKYTSAPDFTGSDARNYFYRYYRGERFEEVSKMLDKLKAFGRPLSQIALNWLLQRRGVTCAIAGARDPWQVRQNAGTADWDLTADQLVLCHTSF